MILSSPCPLCGGLARFCAESNNRPFYACSSCGLIHLLPSRRLSLEDEKNRYQLHQNHPQDLNYRAFLDRMLGPLSRKLTRGSEGLDYGCGPGPTASLMMRERGYSMRDYDPFFNPDEAALNQRYDFIVCTETAEHFYNPAVEFEKLNRLLKPGGWFGLMTAIYDSNQIDLGAWYYAKDPTHVSIYTRQTMEWIAEKYKWSCEFVEDKGVIFYKAT